MVRAFRHALLVALSLASAGCVPYMSTYVQLAVATQVPLPEENLAPVDIRIYRSSVPDRAYREIGVAFVRYASDMTDLGAHWREAAAAIGGDALIDMQVVSGGYIATVITWEDEGDLGEVGEAKEGAAP